MSIEFKPLGTEFVAQASGVDLRQPLDRADREAIDRAMDRYAVLVFHGQPLSTQEQVAFAQNFGPLDFGLRAGTKVDSGYGLGVDDVSNVAANGSIAARSGHQIVSSMANRLWHKDCGGTPVSYSILNAMAVTTEGGETEFADLRAAYDTLPPLLRAEVEGRVAVHHALRSRVVLGLQYTDEQLAHFPPLHLPLVRTHPGSGRKHLFIGAHASHVDGLTMAEGRVLLADLQEHATQPRFVYRHVWAPGDLVMWDNRTTLHRGLRYDITQQRQLRRVTLTDVAGAAAAAAQATAAPVH